VIIRTAVLEGSVPEADRAGFDARMRETVLPAIARYPGLRRATLRRSAEAEAGAPPVYMTFELWFDDLDAMNAALASPVRQEVRARIAEAMGPFQGRVYHLVLEEAGETGPAA
jgi:uncharacterized protein (TIGR02118 family)